MRRIVFLLFVLAAIDAFSQKDKLPYSVAEYTRAMMKMAEQARIEFDVSGIVVEEKGTPLNDVKMTVYQSKSLWFDKYIDSTRTKSVNGEFSVKTSKQDILTLSFSKRGYYDSKKISFTRGDYRKQIKNRVLTIKNLKIVLRKIGKLAKLDHFAMRLKVGENWNGEVLNLRKPSKKKDEEDWEEDEGWYEVKILDVRKKKALPENCLYLYVERNAAGKFLTKKKIYRTKEDMRPVCDPYELEDFTPEELKRYMKEETANSKPYPKRVELRFSDSDAGFFKVKNPKDDISLDENGKMRLAPLKGYEKTLRLDFAPRSSNEIYFYFKLKGCYGKGRVYNFSYDEYDHLVDADVKCYINRSGSRNLETLD